MPLSRTSAGGYDTPTANPLNYISNPTGPSNHATSNTLPQGFVLKLPPLITCKLPPEASPGQGKSSGSLTLQFGSAAATPFPILDYSSWGADTPVGWPLIKLMMFDDFWSRFHRRFLPLTISMGSRPGTATTYGAPPPDHYTAFDMHRKAFKSESSTRRDLWLSYCVGFCAEKEITGMKWGLYLFYFIS